MKKLLSVFLAILMFFMLVSCSKKGKIEEQKVSKAEDQNKAVNAIKEKTHLDKLCDFIAKNGVYEEEDGNYTYIEKIWEDEEDVAYLSLEHDVDNNVTVEFYRKYESPYEISVDSDDRVEHLIFTTLELSQNNSSIPVSFFESEKTPYVNSYFTGDSLYLKATGEIYPEQVYPDNAKVRNIDFSYDCTISSYDYSDAKTSVEKSFSPHVEFLISTLDYILKEYTDISIKDLGFTKW